VSWIAGVDGCRAGWVVALVEERAQGTPVHDIRICTRFDEILLLSPRPKVIAIDIPIGLLDELQPGGRTCDKQARTLLGPRASSVFSPPARAMLPATQYEEVRKHGMSRQAFGILPKIRQVDQLMTAGLQQRVHEAHPELAFRSLTGAPMRHNKKTREGREERIRAFAQASNRLFHEIRPVLEKALKTYTRVQVAPDDILDAVVLAWTALRIAGGQADRVPACPQVDRKGLRMEICY
jgi:predicted RNase H-like nuclease